MEQAGASLFGLALPAFTAVDAAMAVVLQPLPRLLAWGCLMAVVAMLLYRLISPQRTLIRVKSEAAAARRQMATFDGEFDELMPIVRRSLTLSLQHVTWIFFPALLASLPLFCCLVWLDATYSYRTPTSGQPVQLSVSPAYEPITSVPPAALDHGSDGWRIDWPQPGAHVALFDERNATLVKLSGSPGSDTIEKFRSWNRLVGNPMGYLPADSPVERLTFQFAPVEVIHSGPAWIRGWEAPFLFSMIVLSILIKVVFRIE